MEGEAKEWLATQDDKVRDAHAAADGQKVPIDESFDVGGEQLEYPGDVAGSPENVINCRCTWLPVIGSVPSSHPLEPGEEPPAPEPTPAPEVDRIPQHFYDDLDALVAVGGKITADQQAYLKRCAQVMGDKTPAMTATSKAGSYYMPGKNYINVGKDLLHKLTDVGTVMAHEMTHAVQSNVIERMVKSDPAVKALWNELEGEIKKAGKFVPHGTDYTDVFSWLDKVIELYGG